MEKLEEEGKHVPKDREHAEGNYARQVRLPTASGLGVYCNKEHDCMVVRTKNSIDFFPYLKQATSTSLNA